MQVIVWSEEIEGIDELFTQFTDALEALGLTVGFYTITAGEESYRPGASYVVLGIGKRKVSLKDIKKELKDSFSKDELSTLEEGSYEE